jgi:hypothetical protein
MQAIYDGRVGLDTLPAQVKIIELPWQSDRDPISVVQQSVGDSDMMRCYQGNCRASNRPIGILKHGSYGLLDRPSVDVRSLGDNRHLVGSAVRDLAEESV